LAHYNSGVVFCQSEPQRGEGLMRMVERTLRKVWPEMYMTDAGL